MQQHCVISTDSVCLRVFFHFYLIDYCSIFLLQFDMQSVVDATELHANDHLNQILLAY